MEQLGQDTSFDIMIENVLNVDVFINNRVYIYLLSESISYFFCRSIGDGQSVWG